MSRARLLRLSRTGLVVLVLAAAGYAVYRNWREVTDTVTHLAWADWLPSFVVLPLAIMCSTMSWQTFVDEIGEPIGIRRGAQIFLVGQLGKYLPGSVWAYVLQLELGRRAGVARARVFTATVFSLAVVVVAALLVGSLAIPSLVTANPDLGVLRLLYVLLPVGVVCLHPAILTWAARLAFRLLTRPLPDHPVRKRAVVSSLAWALASYLVFGVHLWLLVRGTRSAIADGPGALGIDSVPLVIGTMAIAMIAGLFFFLLPSGAGVREVIIVAGLGGLLGTGPAIAVAAVSRVFLTVADLVTAGVAALLAIREQRLTGPYHGDPGIAADEA